MAVSVSLLILVGCEDSTKLSEPTVGGRDAARMSLEEYASLCAQYADDEIPEGATNGEVSEALARSIELMESVNPPPEVADYHNETLSYGNALKGLVDSQPKDEQPNLLAFVVLIPQGLAVEDAMNSLDPEVRRMLAAAGCAQDVESVAEGDGPLTMTFAVQGSANRIDWTAVAGAEFYKVYYGNLEDCYVNRDGVPSGCRELASSVVGTTYVHEEPHRDLNYYWVSACDAGGCSFIYSERSAAFSGEAVDLPTNLRYEREGARVILSWDPSEWATHYKIYFDAFGGMNCSVSQIGLTLGCDELDDNVPHTSYVHESGGASPSYWVIACNRGGCSEVDSDNPAKPVTQRPNAPGGQNHRVEGSVIRITWDPVPGADFYTIYYDDFSDSRCRLSIDGSPSFCEVLAADVTATSYVHTNPSHRESHYWVVACNRGGCSEIDSYNPAIP